MKKAILLINSLLLMSLAACVTSTDKGQRIVTEEKFREIVVGKTLKQTRYNVTVILTPEGRIEGMEPSGKLEGNWAWVGTRFCREIITAPLIGRACQVVTLKDDKVSFKDSKGEIRTATYRIES